MKAFFLRHKTLHIWLICDLLALGLFYLLRTNRSLMNFLARRVTAPLRRSIAALTYRTDLSVMEVLCVLLVLLTAMYLLWSAVAVLRSQERLHRLYSALLGAGCFGLSIWAAFCLLWGINCWTDGFQTQSGIYAEPISREDLAAVTLYFARQLSESAATVERDENGSFAVPREEILADSLHVYDALEEQFPFLAYEDVGVKGVHFSRVMSALDFTGIFCPFTAEANVNMDAPASRLPCTAAHELAHQRGFFSEQECNFLGILASTTSAIPAYEYSGWTSAFIYAGNALYSVDPELYWAIRELLPPEVEQDFADSAAYWAQFEEAPSQQISNTVYDGVLKAWGDERGIRSYGTVVDLLVAYYKDLI